jgi:hypothetical protein
MDTPVQRGWGVVDRWVREVNIGDDEGDNEDYVGTAKVEEQAERTQLHEQSSEQHHRMTVASWHYTLVEGAGGLYSACCLHSVFVLSRP